MEKTNMSVIEMAEYLSIGKTLAYSLIHEPGFPAVKLSSGKYIVPKTALDKWILEKAGKAAEE